MPDTSFLSNSLGLSRTHLFGQLYILVYHAQPAGSVVPRSLALEVTSAAISVDNKDKSLPNDQTKEVYQRCIPK